MKTIFKILLCSMIMFSCNNDDDNNIAPIDQLPPATQTGAGTFGCLINGEAFVDTSGGFNCFYQLVDGGYYFNISGEDNIFIDQVRIASEAEEVSIGEYNLNCNVNGSFYAEISFNGILLGSNTCETDFGFLIFTNFDSTQNIVSGTFEFDVINPQDNSVIQIREGRFDAQFTQ